MRGPGTPASIRTALAAGLLYLLAAMISLALSRTPGSIATLWYANAVMVAIAVHQPWRMTPLLLITAGIACSVANMAWGDPWHTAWRYIPPNLLEIAAATGLLKRAGMDRRSIEDPRALLLLLLLGCVVAPLTSATTGALLLSNELPADFFAIALSWMASAVVGGASVLPLAFLVIRHGHSTIDALARNPLFWGILCTSVGTTIMVHAYLPYPFVYTTLPLMVSAMALPMAGTTLITLVTSLTLGLMMAMGILIPPPLTWAWQQVFIYLALAAALVPAQVLAAARSQLDLSQQRLTRSARSLQQANEGLQQFIRMASHDLREPVNTVSQFAGLLRDDHAQKLPEDAQDYLGRIDRGAQRMRVLLDDVVQYASLVQQTSIERMLPVDLNACVASACQSLKPVIARRRADISVQTLPVVLGDAALLTLMLRQLLDNALKFTPPGRVPCIDIVAKLDGGMATISITDNGMGIEEQYADRLFEPFTRLTTRRAHDGSGLGLAVCRRIVQLHHGRIGIRPAASEGAVIDICLPFK